MSSNRNELYEDADGTCDNPLGEGREALAMDYVFDNDGLTQSFGCTGGEIVWGPKRTDYFWAVAAGYVARSAGATTQNNLPTREGGLVDTPCQNSTTQGKGLVALPVTITEGKVKETEKTRQRAGSGMVWYRNGIRFPVPVYQWESGQGISELRGGTAGYRSMINPGLRETTGMNHVRDNPFPWRAEVKAARRRFRREATRSVDLG
ncbi:uncharacterized protein EI90DRAFT_3015950 [Cantharellus anzutake]|uniref:uncharacterized protein n=1 Tax=Cantharellus anzutake TaxID=1750568 RepID=UPI001905041C|nr:uncharacterized protein EI90DRAFT_3015950 [Cantharellus anzutake]KAF8332361.1 hypothetical protein EI90DRAFT_3015950 [Cantharellus anzutake]